MIDDQWTLVDTNPGFDLDEVGGSAARTRVLIVDDDSEMVYLLKHLFRKEGMDVMGAASGYEALRKCADLEPDIVLLDLMMPGMDGWETLRRIRQFSKVPVIALTAKGTKKEVVTGLESGVDDYLVKPCHGLEVVARVRAVLRRAPPVNRASEVAVFPYAGLMIDFESRYVTLHENTVDLTQKEFALLSVLARGAPKPIPYKEIAEAIWGDGGPAVSGRIKFLAFALRRKLETDPVAPKLIVNQAGFGYGLRSEPELARL